MQVIPRREFKAAIGIENNFDRKFSSDGAPFVLIKSAVAVFPVLDFSFQKHGGNPNFFDF